MYIYNITVTIDIKFAVTSGRYDICQTPFYSTFQDGVCGMIKCHSWLFMNSECYVTDEHND